MDGLGEKDAFVLRGKTFEIEKGKRYRLSWKDGSVYEGTYLGFLEIHPLCRTVTLVEVTRVTGNRDALDEESIFLSFEKRGIMHIEEIENDFSAILEAIGPKIPDENYKAELN
jgi:hypothetical protein